MILHNIPCTITPTEPSAIDILNKRVASVTNRVTNTNIKLDKLSQEVNNLDDALCEFSTDVEIRVSDVEDALCELSEEE